MSLGWACGTREAPWSCRAGPSSAQWTGRAPPGSSSATSRSSPAHLGRPASLTPRQATTRGIELSYCSTWDKPWLHGSLAGSEWATETLTPIVSGGGRWHSVSVPLTGKSRQVKRAQQEDVPLLEFALTDGHDRWDKPGAQAGPSTNYVIGHPGRYCLRDGSLADVSSSRRVMLVTDLDETLIGDDAATAAFRDWWVGTALPAGSRLVYNTGRSLELFLDLLSSKAGILPEPDLLISAVGTRLYSRTGNKSGTWRPIAEYEARLDRGWDLQAVREAAYEELARVGRDSMHFRPPVEQNEHKVTCGVRLDILGEVLRDLEDKLTGKGLAVRCVSSGAGDWRFVDLIPDLAGKRQAMEFAAKLLHFTKDEVVAAGDSANDIDMLEGARHSIIVANAQEDLLRWLKLREDGRHRNGKKMVQTQGCRAWGVLEGLSILGFCDGARSDL